jgi:hypothetical protein
MALIACTECGQQVSTTTDSCPTCGNTRFLSPTGNEETRKCYSCGGRGTLYGDKWDRKPYPCNYCDGNGSRELIEVIDLRTNKTLWMLPWEL